ncbi:MAG: hypothetical protein IJW73_06185 [Candidatus Gastranaerophilales bacterium]|nr:hypothetical protein [Candidatus Gastranaerophilales bacterium]
MGLDGISINQLRTPENSSAEISRIARSSVNNEHKTVDGLSQGQKVDPDQGREKDQQLKQGLASNNQDEEEDEIQEEVIKYDLSDNNKYFLKLDENSNNILIVDKATKNVVTQIDADELSQYVSFLSNSQGSIVNRKF